MAPKCRSRLICVSSLYRFVNILMFLDSAPLPWPGMSGAKEPIAIYARLQLAENLPVNAVLPSHVQQVMETCASIRHISLDLFDAAHRRDVKAEHLNRSLGDTGHCFRDGQIFQRHTNCE